MSKPVSFIAGAMCGAVIGAVAALLLTPESGQDLQERARERVEGVLSEARQAAEERRAEMEAQLAKLRAPRAAAD
ncbi:MAG: YtxH domain-containing protein [Chloroflexi bacterium]|nr:YtxH domain-containing protein [Chloroflexota bacterium]